MLENTLPISEFRSKLPEVLRLLGKLHQRFTITQRGKPKAVILEFEEFEGWMETLEISSDKELVKDIKKAEEDVHANRLYSHREVFGKEL
jgi:antitoxin YefM